MPGELNVLSLPSSQGSAETANQHGTLIHYIFNVAVVVVVIYIFAFLSYQSVAKRD